MYDLTNQILDTIKIIILAAAVVLSVNYVFAAPWTGPNGEPPTNNVEPPVNVSNNSQVKLGELGVNKLTAGYVESIASSFTNTFAGPIQAAAISGTSLSAGSGAITGGSLNIGSGLITAGDGATSALSVGTSNNSTRTYLKIDAESTGGVKPPAADCADETDYGKMMFAFDQSYIYVCGYDVVNQIPAWWYADMQLQLPQS